MTKKFLLTLILYILSVSVCIAQNKQDEYNKLVDYVNCKYAVEYINKNKSEIKNTGYVKDFEKYKNAFNYNVHSYSDIYYGYDKTIKNSSAVYDALNKSAIGFSKAKELWKFIDDKKKNYSSDWSKEQMINYLILLSDDVIKISGQKIKFKTFLSSTTNQLKKDLEKQISDSLFATNEEMGFKEKETPFTKHEEEKDSRSTNSSTYEVKDTPCNPEKVEISISSLSLKKGKERTLRVKISPCNKNVDLIWESNNDSIATVKDGKITAIREGKANISVTIKGTGIKDECRVTVLKSRSFGKYFFIILFVAVLGFFGYKKRIGLMKNLKNRFQFKSAKTEENEAHDFQGDMNGIGQLPKQKKELSIEQLEKRIKELELENKQIHNYEKENAELRTRNKQFEQRIRELEGQKPSKAESEIRQPNINIVPVVKEEKVVSINATYLYADAIIDGEFHRTNEQPNDDTVFELVLTPSARTTPFHIYREAYRRVIKNPDFVDGCEKQKINTQPQDLVVENGEAIQDDLGKWKVIKKAIIKFV